MPGERGNWALRGRATLAGISQECPATGVEPVAGGLSCAPNHDAIVAKGHPVPPVFPAE
jgi:hypothetical protein